MAVELAIPQFENAYAAANPRTPIHATDRRSSRDNGGAEPRGRASGARTSAPTTNLTIASVAGGTEARVTRAATYEVA